jgi:hypothetical protein
VPFERVPGTEVIGGEKGLEGFKQAVLYVYKILEPPGLGESKFESLLYPAGKTEQSWPSSRVSAVTGITAISMDDYVGQLWDHCWKYDTSPFGALYLWTAAWYIDLGNAYNIHIAPLRQSGLHAELAHEVETSVEHRSNVSIDYITPRDPQQYLCDGGWI